MALGHRHLKLPTAERAPLWPPALSGVTAQKYGPAASAPGTASTVPAVRTGLRSVPSTGDASAGSVAIVTSYRAAPGTGLQLSTSGSAGHVTVAPSVGASSAGRVFQSSTTERGTDQRPARSAAFNARTRQ